VANNFLSKIITGDEKLCFRYDPESKEHSLQWKDLTSPTTQERLHVQITNEDNAHLFSNIKGAVHSKYIPQSQTINQAYYVEIMKQLC
jgi:hypothetical protein